MTAGVVPSSECLPGVACTSRKTSTENKWGQFSFKLRFLLLLLLFLKLFLEKGHS